AMSQFAPKVGFTALVVLVGGALGGLWRLGFFEFGETAEMLALRRRNLELRTAVHTIATNLRHATSIGEIADSIAGVAPALHAIKVRLDVPGAFIIQDGEPAANSEPILQGVPAASCARYPVEPGFGYLEIEWTQAGGEPDRDHEIAAEALCCALSRALERTLAETSTTLEPTPVPLPAQVRPTATRTRRR